MHPNSNDRDMLVRLSSGLCEPISSQRVAQEVVLVQSTPLPEQSACAVGPTVATVIDVDKISFRDCEVVEFRFFNNGATDEKLIFGRSAFTGAYAYNCKGQLPPSAVDNINIINPDCDGATGEDGFPINSHQAPELQRFNQQTSRVAVIVKDILVTNEDPVNCPAQTKQKITIESDNFGDDSCKRTIVAPVCNTACPSSDDDDTRMFSGTFVVDSMHGFTYVLKAGCEVSFQLFLAAKATAHNFVPCA